MKYDKVISDKNYKLENLSHHEVEEMKSLLVNLQISIRVKLENAQKSANKFSSTFAELLEILPNYFGKSNKFIKK